MRSIFWLVGLTLFVASLTFGSDSNPAKNPNLALEPLTLPKITLAGFAELPPIKDVDALAARLTDSSTTAAMADNYRAVIRFLGLALSERQRNFIDKNKFLLIPIGETHLKTAGGPDGDWSDDMLSAFDGIGGSEDPADRKPENARLVTPDVVLHAFHKFLENSLEQLESTELSEVLGRFLVAAQDAALRGQNATDGELSRRFETLAAQWTVPLVLLRDSKNSLAGAKALLEKEKKKFSTETAALMAGELELIYAAESVAHSPLYGFYDTSIVTDYTQFRPRSHYTKSPALSGYFRAMIYLGRNGYALNPSAGPDRTRGLSDSLLVAYTLAAARNEDGSPALSNWKRMMDVTSFYAGPSDDLTYSDWRDFLTETLGTQAIRAELALDSATIEKLRASVDGLRPPAVFGEAVIKPRNREEITGATAREPSKSLRLFGQRFTLDAWVLGRLTGQGSPSALPRQPSGLFVSAALGSRSAAEFAGQFLVRTAGFTAEQLAGFSSALQEVRSALEGIDDSGWFNSVGTQWLRVLGSQTQVFDEGYPLYMRGPAFSVKQIQTLLGSYAELKHDTLLYAKQSYAERGGGGEERELPPAPKGFVEPNLRFWNELQRLARFTLDGFKQRNLLPVTTEEFGVLDRFVNDVNFCAKIAEEELQGKPVGDGEYEALRALNLDYMAAPLEAGKVLDREQRRVALIADIYTDVIDKQIVYEATAEPYVMIALIGNEGSPRLVTGLVFNHYELALPLGQRLTDENWKQTVYRHHGALPKKNFWYESLLPR